jgi:hypothetical protein
VEHSTTRNDEILIVKHRLQTTAKAGWKAEAWLDGSSYPGYYPIDVWIRLTPEDPQVKQLPKVKVQVLLALVGAVKPIRQALLEPEFQECAKMKKRKETILTGGKDQPILNFPPKESCWETIIRDPFKSDRLADATRPLEIGSYTLKVEAMLQGGPALALEAMPIRVERGYPRP